MADLDPNSLNKLRVIDLREQLSCRGLPTSGLKADLVNRLRDALLAAQAENENSPETVQGDESMDVDSSTDEEPVVAEQEIRNKENDQLKTEEEARCRAEEEARHRAEEEARHRAEEEARYRAEEEARYRAEEEARHRAEEEEARLRAEEARRRAEEEARHKAEEEARHRAEEEARHRAEEDARLRAEEEARHRAEEEAKQRAEEEAKRKAEEETRRRTVQVKIKNEEEESKRKQEARLRAEELSRKRREEEIKLKREEEERQKFELKKREVEKLEEERKRAERIAREEEMKMEQERWLVAEQIRQAQEEQKKKVRVEEEKLEANTEEQNTINNQVLTEDIELPQAIEKALALKSERVQLLETDQDITNRAPAKQIAKNLALVSVADEDAEDEESLPKEKDTKGKRRRKKRKKRSAKHQDKKDVIHYSDNSSKDSGIDVDVEYVQEVINITDPLYSQFMRIFERFKLTDAEKEEEAAAEIQKEKEKEESVNPLLLRKKPMDIDEEDDDDPDDKVEEEKPKLSKRKMKKLSRMTVAELKQKVNRPELVEMHDVTAKDPVLLLHLKASRNTVPVPRHWCFKRKYLQGKRGIEKPAFELPEFIKRTGIMEMRQALQEKEDQKTMKAKMRERVRPKLGKIDIDYQKLHDAFFKWQTKPKMTIHGDLYYEGKEFETRLKEKKPGDLSEDLRTALGMPTGPNANKCPPPWLIAMQRYGPPPSYPNLKIPGLNAPIPDDCTFGYHAGGWGKPPVDETGRPLYGDVFGTTLSESQLNIHEEEIDHTLWGELESESSEESEEEEEEEEEDEEEKPEDESGLVTPAEGLITPSGFSSIPAGMETPDMIELRKRKIESEIEGGDTPALYTILPEKKGERIGAAMMGSTHTYDLAGAIPAGKTAKSGISSVAPQGVEVALDPSELEMDSAAMAARYEQTMREQQSQLEKEDLSDMVAEHAARQKNKRKKQQMTSAKPPKKYKEFKF